MSRFRFRSQAALLYLNLVTWMIGSSPAWAGLCEKDTACRDAVEHANAAMTSQQRRGVIVELQAVRRRIPDPRLLAILGRLQQKEGQNQEAQESCEQAQIHAPGDRELQQKAKECIDKARSAIEQESKKPSETILKRAEARGGAAHAQSTAINNTIINMPAPGSPPVQIVQVPPQKQPQSQRRWVRWVDLGLGVGVAAAVAVGLGVGLSSREPDTTGVVNYPFLLRVQ